MDFQRPTTKSAHSICLKSGKRRHYKHHEAERIAVALLFYTGLPSSTYKRRWCGNYHLTTKYAA
jgi:hypothetical protein